jgi:hypothetical protein
MVVASTFSIHQKYAFLSSVRLVLSIVRLFRPSNVCSAVTKPTVIHVGFSFKHQATWEKIRTDAAADSFLSFVRPRRLNLLSMNTTLYPSGIGFPNDNVLLS